MIRKLCPDCKTKSFINRNWIRATVLIEGKRAPASWEYYECLECGKKWKLPLNGSFEHPGDEEWKQHCSNTDNSK